MITKTEEKIKQMKKIHQEKTAFDESITFTFCTRDLWGAVPPKSPGTKLKHPVQNVRFSDTSSPTCFTPKECFRVLQDLQRKHMEVEGLSDIKFNFLVGGDGTIYEGRGWHVDNDRPPEYDDLKGNCIDIGHIGDLTDDSQNENRLMLGDDDTEKFPQLASEKYGYAWSVYGQQDNKYIAQPFRVIQKEL